MQEISASLDLLEHATGIVIPVYIRDDHNISIARELVENTVRMFVREVADPANVCLSIDGPGPAVKLAQDLAAALGAQVIVGKQNLGKFGAVAAGMSRLLASQRLRYLAAVDQDGDHFANELLNFVRAAEHVASAAATDRILVQGNRASRHRPLGFLRAEQEELANRMLLDALTYHASIAGRPLHLEYLTTTTPLPDFHSGYKLFSRPVAEAVFSASPHLEGLDGADRHACEAVMVVESYLAGAFLAAINRSTFDEQPISLFAAYDRARLAADMILWPCRRLAVPGHFVAQWLANHLPTLLLSTLAPQGQNELLAIRDLVLTAYGEDPASTEPAAFARPRFV